MSETIPEDIRDAARRAIEGWTIDDGTTRQFEACAESVARAILAERERIAAAIRVPSAGAAA